MSGWAWGWIGPSLLPHPCPAQEHSNTTYSVHTSLLDQMWDFQTQTGCLCTSPAIETLPLVPGETSSPMEGVKSWWVSWMSWSPLCGKGES